MPLLETTFALLILWAIIGYLMGSIPSGMILARVLGLGDLRSIGSGNIGATNVLRTGSKGAAAGTLLLDAAKGAMPVLLAGWLAGEDAAQLAALAAFLGHCFPIWLGFRGGKGVATFLGVALALAWPVGLLCCATWLATAAITRISSLSALVAAVSAPVWMLVLGYWSMLVLGILLAALILWRHSANIARLRAGTEPRIGAK
ncbi:glycerol-3-phosphate 1-O-acyltransferase PlsY [Roseovarius dicentrarchi]|uniref:glycerol-3-phosphate 1-O-acyltransferase PlsY n=1 Tax=Roseovarius dicentrarchi TaxID=2250573 RepID=UPI000DE8DBCE|nr:glycerol-3-phosphate 1-O-acyltransferase PlsY [Roseovarius dicentrarchi]